VDCCAQWLVTDVWLDILIGDSRILLQGLALSYKRHIQTIAWNEFRQLQPFPPSKAVWRSIDTRTRMHKPPELKGKVEIMRCTIWCSDW
jgi:hypothetical protein